MYRLLDGEQKRIVRKDKRSDNLFRVLEQVLWQRSPWMPAPEDVWCEALYIVKGVAQTEAEYRDMEVRAMLADLTLKYSVIVNENGQKAYTENDTAPRTMAMWTMISAMYMMLDFSPTLEENPYTGACRKIKQLIRDEADFLRVYEGFREAEDRIEETGNEIPIHDYTNDIIHKQSMKEQKNNHNGITLDKEDVFRLIKEQKPNVIVNEGGIANMEGSNPTINYFANKRQVYNPGPTQNDNDIPAFAQLIPHPECAKRVSEKLHELMERQSTPIKKLMPLRAAMDAGVLSRPTWDVFCQEFGENFISSKSLLSKYTGENYQYTGEAFEETKAIFKQIIE